MARYTIDIPDDTGNIHIECHEHGEWTEYESHYRSVTFYCESCDRELTIELESLDDWRELTELC